MKVLWETYQIRRDYFRRKKERQAKQSLGLTAKKLIRRIARINSRPELGRVGRKLYDAMGGTLSLPGPVSQPEWAVVFEAYRRRKVHLLESR